MKRISNFKLLPYMERQERNMRRLLKAHDDEVRLLNAVAGIDAVIRRALKINTAHMILPADWWAVIDWLDGAEICVLRDIDRCEGGIFYYYLCRQGLL